MKSLCLNAAVSPCIDCKERCVSGHSTCEKYLDSRKECDKYKETKYKRLYYIDYKRESVHRRKTGETAQRVKDWRRKRSKELETL